MHKNVVRNGQICCAGDPATFCRDCRAVESPRALGAVTDDEPYLGIAALTVALGGRVYSGVTPAYRASTPPALAAELVAAAFDPHFVTRPLAPTGKHSYRVVVQVPPPPDLFAAIRAARHVAAPTVTRSAAGGGVPAPPSLFAAMRDAGQR